MAEGKTYIVYVESACVIDEKDLLVDGVSTTPEEAARQWFIEKLQRNEVQFTVDSEELPSETVSQDTGNPVPDIGYTPPKTGQWGDDYPRKSDG